MASSSAVYVGSAGSFDWLSKYDNLLHTLIFVLLFSIWKKDAVSVDIARVDIVRIDIALRSFSCAAKDGTIFIYQRYRALPSKL